MLDVHVKQQCTSGFAFPLSYAKLLAELYIFSTLFWHKCALDQIHRLSAAANENVMLVTMALPWLLSVTRFFALLLVPVARWYLRQRCKVDLRIDELWTLKISMKYRSRTDLGRLSLALRLVR
ncbi:hypothetical protein L6232_03485 [Shewanella sp. C31]|nr:hypothetical protein [Shewanella electrica]